MENTSTPVAEPKTGTLETVHRYDAPEVVYAPEQPQAGYGYTQQEYTPNPQPYRTICGVRARNFWLLLALALVLVAAAVGGSVGGSLAVQNSKTREQQQLAMAAQSASSNPTSTSTTAISSTSATSTLASASSSVTAYSVLPAPKVQSLQLDTSASILSSSWNSIPIFKPYYGTSMAGGDIMALTAYTIQSCVDACLTWNTFPNTIAASGSCVGMEWRSSMADTTSTNSGANCWLKSAPLPNRYAWSTGTTAILCGDAKCNSTVA